MIETPNLIDYNSSMERGLLIILSGPSGVGKGTVRKELMKDASLNLVYSISMTTRLPRNGEKEGIDYFFVTFDEFKKAIKEGKLLEYAKFVDNYYGTPKDYVDKIRDEGKNVLLEIETHGAKEILKKKSSNDEIFIFLNTPSFEELERRIRERKTESEEVIQERLKKAQIEISLKSMYDYVVINDTPANAAKRIKEIILSHK